MRHALIISLAITFYIFNATKLTGCTAFSLQYKDQNVLAKNLDWPINNGLIFINKRGVEKTAFNGNDKKLSWVSKYGSITFNQFGKEFPLGGMNEAGLVIEELNSWGRPPESKANNNLNEFQWVQYHLDNFASVEEIVNQKQLVVIEPVLVNLHYIISDRSGNTAIVEFHNQKIHIHQGGDLPYPVLSNNHYKNSLQYIKNFKGFGGHQPLKKENTSNERFVRAAALIKKFKTKQKPGIASNAFAILDSVKQVDTQWSIVYDITNNQIHFQTKNFNTEKTINLQKIDFSCKKPVQITTIQTKAPGEISSRFIPFRPKYNNQLLKNVYEKYTIHALGNLPKSFFLKLAEHGNFISCEPKPK